LLINRFKTRTPNEFSSSSMITQKQEYKEMMDRKAALESNTVAVLATVPTELNAKANSTTNKHQQSSTEAFFFCNYLSA